MAPMRRSIDYRAALVLSAALTGTTLVSGGLVREAAYAGQRWDDRGDAAYRRHLAGQHGERHDFNHLNVQQQP